jgi:hypothetical protein
MAAIEIPDDSAFEKKERLDKYGNFNSFKQGKKYLVNKCETKATGFGRKMLIEASDPLTKEEFTLWAPADFVTVLRKNFIRWKEPFWLLYKGKEDRPLKETEGTYSAHVYMLAQPSIKDKSKSKSKTKSKSKSKDKKDEGEESSA